MSGSSIAQFYYEIDSGVYGKQNLILILVVFLRVSFLFGAVYETVRSHIIVFTIIINLIMRFI